MARRSEQADFIDRIIGQRIRQQREDLGMTQGELATATGVSYQQIHKYESGTNRISAGRLGIIAQTLRQPVQHFYEGVHEAHEAVPDNKLCLELARNFRKLGNHRQREALHMLVSVLADQHATRAK